MENYEFRHNYYGFFSMKLKKIEISVPKSTAYYDFRHKTTGFSHRSLRKFKKFVPKSTDNCEFRHKMTVTPRKKLETIVTPITETFLKQNY